MSLAMTLMLAGAACLVAVAVSVSLEAARRERAGQVAAAGALIGGCVLLFGSASATPANAWGPIWLGGAFSSVSGATLAAGAIALLALDGARAASSSGPLIALGAAGSAVAALSGDLLLTVIALETAALAGYALVMGGRSALAPDATMRYFVQGAIATVILVAGLSVLGASGSPGSLEMRSPEFAAGIGIASALGGATLVLAGLLVKAGAAPFHWWVPDAYEGAPPLAAGFLATGPKAAAVLAATGLVLRLAEGPSDGATAIVVVCAVVSIIAGTAGALAQRSYTRMLGYSSVAQVGFALVALAASSGTQAAFFVVTYTIGSVAAFLGAEAMRRIDPSWDGSIDGMAGLGHRAPLLAGSISIALLSLTGVPPLIGFWGKLGVFVEAIAAGRTWLAVLGLIASVVSFAFYGGVIRVMYFDDAPRERVAAPRTLLALTLSVGLLALGGAAMLWAGMDWVGVLFAMS